MSLDGFITGPGEGVGNPLGDDGRLHDWMSAEACPYGSAGMIEWMHVQLAEERMMLWRVDIPVDVRCGDGISQLTAKATEVATRRKEQ